MTAPVQPSQPDIVERLRELAKREDCLSHDCDMRPEHTANFEYAKWLREAAEEIKRLRAVLVGLNAAIDCYWNIGLDRDAGVKRICHWQAEAKRVLEFWITAFPQKTRPDHCPICGHSHDPKCGEDTSSFSLEQEKSHDR